ncbi:MULTISPECIES: bile acid:sodium symporter family protein [unclassified Janthinobacterium]|uniref:bile acid:sodium symporter family protein n=1 Tax=unclassified Janthinobacterium TaxID=2610881 RepID=UPI0018CA12E3|nr:bile acid:sodium symporter family protein [Janthinobacterium sp. CG_23.4]MDH6160261.1 sodium/bile acid cotransporter 7 [Janthinobacterium sp. CG_23.4]
MSSFSPAALLRNLKPDNFTIALLVTVALASFLPCTGTTALVFGHVTTVAIGALFFLHGAKLSREAVVAGVMHWRLHVLVLASTFILFPLLGLALRPLALTFLTPELYVGILFLCALPSTVQSSIALTAMARGNVPAAICSASASNFIGIFLAPILVGLLVAKGADSKSSLDAVLSIVMQLLLPFLAGQFLRRWIGRWVDRHKAMLKFFDQGSILLVVYTAFSEAVSEGLWQTVSVETLIALCLFSIVLLALVLCLMTFISRRLGFSKEDEIAIVFCGSKKSLASGVPMAKVLFATHSLGMVILPLMLFHQIQLMICAVIAQRYARRDEVVEVPASTL